MLYVSKKTDYALVALAFLAERPARQASAREIAQSAELPLNLLSNILKTLQHAKIVRSTRGVKGGYQISADLNSISLWHMMDVLERVDREEGHDCCDTVSRYKLNREPAVHQPAVALQYKLIDFLENVKLSDLVQPGRRIDVPVQLVRVMEKSNKTKAQQAGNGPKSADLQVVS